MKGQWKLNILFLLIGLVLGIGIDHMAAGYHLKKKPTEKKRFERKFTRFDKKLNLNSNQREKIREIFETNHQKIMALRMEMKPKMDAIKKSAMDEVRPLLTEEQKNKFQKMEERWMKRHRKMGNRGPHGDHGPRGRHWE